MPLSPPVEREALHRRAIELNGYRRTDGLFDIEAHSGGYEKLPVRQP